MAAYPLTDPSQLERMLFDAGLMEHVPLSAPAEKTEISDALLEWHDSVRDQAPPNVHNPAHWGNNLWGCTRWEFFAYAFREGRRVLDVGCGEARLTFYLARRGFEVIGLDVSPGRLLEARTAARLIGMAEVPFQEASIEDLPYEEASFDGVSASGNVFTYGYDTPRMFAEIYRVLRPGGVFAIEQWRGDPDAPPVEQPGWFLGVDPPFLEYRVSRGLYGRATTIFLRPGSPQAEVLAGVGPGVTGYLSGKQKQVCEQLLEEMRQGDLSCVERATYAGDHRSLAPEELPRLLAEAGFVGFTSWGVPDGVAFARSLRESGVLAKLNQEDLLPCLGALLASATQFEVWAADDVTCRKP